MLSGNVSRVMKVSIGGSERELMATLPVHEFRRGPIRVRIWRKRTQQGIRHHVSVVRLFQRNDVWNESTRFGRDDIPLVLFVLDEAHTWIFQSRKGNE